MGRHGLGEAGTLPSAWALLLRNDADLEDEGRELRCADGRLLRPIASECNVEL